MVLLSFQSLNTILYYINDNFSNDQRELTCNRNVIKITALTIIDTNKMKACLRKVLIFFFSFLSTARGQLVPVHEVNNEGGVKCFIQYIYSYFKFNNLIIYQNYSHEWEIRDDVITQLVQSQEGFKKFTVSILSSNHNPQVCVDKEQFQKQLLIFIDTESEFNNAFQYCLRKARSSSRILIVIRDPRVTISIYQLMKKYKLFSHPLVSDINNNSISLYIARPLYYESSNVSDVVFYKCTDQNTHQTVSSHQVREIKYSVLKIGIRKAPFEKFKTAQNLSTHRKLSKHPLHMIEFLAIDKMMNSLHIKREYIPLETEELGVYDDEHEVGHGVINELIEGKLDVIFGTISHPFPSSRVKSTQLMGYNNMIAIIRKLKVPRAYAAFAMYTWPVWMCISLAYLCFNILLYTIKYLQNGVMINSVAFKLITSFLGQSIRNNRKFPKLLFLSWIWFTFLMRAYYDSYTKQLFVDKDSHKQIDTLEEICLNGFKILMPDLAYDHFKTGLRLTNCNITSDKMRNVDDPLKYLRDSKTDALAVFMSDAIYAANLKNDLNKPTDFHVLKESVGFIVYYVYARHGEEINDLIANQNAMIVEGGLVRRGEDGMDILAKSVNFKGQLLENRALSLKNVEAAFYVLFFGMILCFFLLYY